MKVKIQLAVFLLSLFLLFDSSPSYAERQIVETTGSCCVETANSDLVSVAQKKAKDSALKTAMEKAGFYVESYSKTSNFLLTDDELKIVLGNVLNIISEDYTMEKLPDGVNSLYKCNIKAEIDTDKIDFHKLKEYRKANNRNITDYYKKDLEKIFTFNNGVTTTIKRNSIHYDSNGYLCFTMVTYSPDTPDLMVSEWAIDNVKKVGVIKLARFYDPNTGEATMLDSPPPTPVTIGQWFNYTPDSIAQYAVNYVKTEEEKLNREFLLTHFSSEKSFLYSLAKKHFETKNNLIPLMHILDKQNEEDYAIIVEAILPDTIENTGNIVKFKTISMAYKTNRNPIIELDDFNISGINHYNIYDWEINKSQKKATRIKHYLYYTNHKVIQQENQNEVFDIPKQVSPNLPMIHNALCDFYQKYAL